MAVRYERPYSRASTWARRLGGFAVLLFIVAALGHRLARMETPNFLVIAGVCTMLALVAFVLALAGLRALWVCGARGGRAAFWGLILSLVLLVPAGLAAERYIALPRIHEVTTDMLAPPAFLEPPVVDHGWLKRPDMPAGKALELQRTAYPELSGRRYEGTIDRVLQATLAVARERNMTIVATEGFERLRSPADPPEMLPETPAEEGPAIASATPENFVAPLPIPAPRGREAPPVLPTRIVIQGVVTDPVFGLPSDVVIRMTAEAATTFVDMRAVARYGSHDLGLGAWHVSHFLRALDAALIGIAGS